MSDFIKRLEKEKEGLADKTHKLFVCRSSAKFLEISKEQQALLIVQFDAMTTYGTCLKERLKQLKD